MTDQEREASRAERVDRSRVLGDFYRATSADYAHYYDTQTWPVTPEGYKTFSQQDLSDHIHNKLGRFAEDEGDDITEHSLPHEIYKAISRENTYHELVPDHFEQIGI